MADVATVVDRYIDTWNQTDPQRRRAIIAETWTEDATYVDPIMSGDGPDGIDTMIAGAQTQFPDHRCELTAGPDVHHDRVRFGWRVVSPEGTTVFAGTDFARLADDGRFRDVTGFLES
jgi:hypothetical protein